MCSRTAGAQHAQAFPKHAKGARWARSGPLGLPCPTHAEEGLPLTGAVCRFREKQAALGEYDNDTLSATTRSARDAKVKTWAALHNEWFGGDVPLLPLTVDRVRAVLRMLKRGGYTSGATYLSAIRSWSRECAVGEGPGVAEETQRAKRSLERGRGPVRQSRSLQLDRLGMLASAGTQWPKEGPLEPLATLVLGTWFLLREIELAAAKLCDLTVDLAASQVSLRIPASKTDTAGLGSTRAHKCICAGPCYLAHCPLRAGLCVLDSASHLARLHSSPPDLFPLFPNHQGRHCSKASIVATIEAAASGLGEPLLDAEGRRLFGGHSLRVGGAKWLAEQGVALTTIAELGRWQSQVVERYVGASVPSTPCVLREDVPAVDVAVCADAPRVYHKVATMPLSLRVFWRTACGIRFGQTGHRVANLPLGSVNCSKCLEGVKGQVGGEKSRGSGAPRPKRPRLE